MSRRAVVVFGVALMLSVVPTACSSDSTSPGAASTASVALAETTSTSTTSTLPPEPTSPAPSAQEAVSAFMNAWRNGDMAAARAIARAAAADAVFGAGEAGSIQNRGCNRPPPDSPVLCVYRTAIGEVQVQAAPVPEGWIVDQAIVSS